MKHQIIFNREKRQIYLGAREDLDERKKFFGNFPVLVCLKLKKYVIKIVSFVLTTGYSNGENTPLYPVFFMNTAISSGVSRIFW